MVHIIESKLHLSGFLCYITILIVHGVATTKCMFHQLIVSIENAVIKNKTFKKKRTDALESSVQFTMMIRALLTK